jgi:predicted DNA-binding transcriptional regulator AlpA
MADPKDHFERRKPVFSGPRPAPPPSNWPPRPSKKLAVDPVEVFVTEAAGAPQLLLPSDVATLLGVGVRTLERWRSTGEGPRFIRLSSKTIRYTDAAVQAFIATKDRANTAESA